MFDIWGSSSKNVWTVGTDAADQANLWHYDGTKWLPVYLPLGSFDLFQVRGFSATDVYAVGDWWHGGSDSSLVIHFDGIEWSDVTPKDRGGFLLSLWGSSSKDVWVGGLGTLYRFDGTNWNRIQYRNDFVIKSIAGLSSTDIYLMSYYFVAPAYTYTVIEHSDGRTLTQLDSTDAVTNTFGSSDLLVIGANSVFSVGYGVFKFTGSTWEKIYSVGSSSGPLSGIAASSASNIFVVGQGIILEYNGVDWYRYSQFTDQNTVYYKAWTDGHEVFVIGQTSGKTVVLHGK